MLVHALVKNRFTNAGLKKKNILNGLNSYKSLNLENKYCVKGGSSSSPPPKIIYCSSLMVICIYAQKYKSIYSFNFMAKNICAKCKKHICDS